MVGRKRKQSEAMKGAVNILVTGVQKEKYRQIPDGADYLRRCIDQWGQGDDAVLISAIGRMTSERDALNRQIAEMQARLTTKMDSSEAKLESVIEEFFRLGVHTREEHMQNGWLFARLDQDTELLRQAKETVAKKLASGDYG